MTEKEYRLAHFEENLAPYRGRRIFLYGFGANTRAILERFDAAFGFAGIVVPAEELEDARSGAAQRNKPVLTLDIALAKKPDAVLIAAQMYGAEAVYQRIEADCRRAGTAILDAYGTDQIALHDELETQGFLDLAGWRAATAPYGAVSFELRDTVLVQDLLHSRKPTVRPVMRRLIGELLAAGKSVVLLAPEELPAAWYADALREAGLLPVSGQEEQPASCTAERAGQLSVLARGVQECFFRELREAFAGVRLLHIGSRLLEDGVMPRLCGVDARRMVFYDKSVLTDFEQAPSETGPAFRRRSAAEARRMIDAADAVSFDLFDTLLVRCVPAPQDVIALTAYRADCLGNSAALRERFYAVRLQEQCGEKTLPQIYDTVAAQLGLSAAAARELQRLERQTERDVITLREPAAELVRYAKAQGKPVLLCTDMYYTGAELAALLKEKGLEDAGRIIVSCEHGLSKADGLLEEVKKAAAQLCARPCRILHVGDSLTADAAPARRAGLSFLHLPSVRELAEAAGFTAPAPCDPDRLPSRAALAARCMAGLWAEAAFAAPFAEEAAEDDRNARLSAYGKTVPAPVQIGFLLWLLPKLAETAPDRVLFAARDGFMLQQWYERVRWKSLPEGTYLYTSRHAAMLPLADRPALAGYLAEAADGLSCAEMMRAFFDAEPLPEQEAPCAAEAGAQRGEAARNARYWYLLRHQPDLSVLAAKAAAGQRAYWKREGLVSGLRCAYVDFVASGTSQRFTEELAPFALQGFYLGRPENGTAPACSIQTWLHAETPNVRRFLDRYMETEYYMTSPEPSLQRFAADGTPVFAGEVRSAEALAEIARVHAAAQEILERFLVCTDWEETVKRAEDPAAVCRQIAQLLPAELLCRMALFGARNAVKRRYFDDWSKRWINDEG